MADSTQAVKADGKFKPLVGYLINVPEICRPALGHIAKAAAGIYSFLGQDVLIVTPKEVQFVGDLYLQVKI